MQVLIPQLLNATITMPEPGTMPPNQHGQMLRKKIQELTEQMFGKPGEQGGQKQQQQPQRPAFGGLAAALRDDSNAPSTLDVPVKAGLTPDQVTNVNRQLLAEQQLQQQNAIAQQELGIRQQNAEAVRQQLGLQTQAHQLRLAEALLPKPVSYDVGVDQKTGEVYRTGSDGSFQRLGQSFDRPEEAPAVKTFTDQRRGLFGSFDPSTGEVSTTQYANPYPAPGASRGGGNRLPKPVSVQDGYGNTMTYFQMPDGSFRAPGELGINLPEVPVEPNLDTTKKATDLARDAEQADLLSVIDSDPDLKEAAVGLRAVIQGGAPELALPQMRSLVANHHPDHYEKIQERSLQRYGAARSGQRPSTDVYVVRPAGAPANAPTGAPTGIPNPSGATFTPAVFGDGIVEANPARIVVIDNEENREAAKRFMLGDIFLGR